MYNIASFLRNLHWLYNFLLAFLHGVGLVVLLIAAVEGDSSVDNSVIMLVASSDAVVISETSVAPVVFVELDTNKPVVDISLNSEVCTVTGLVILCISDAVDSV